MKLKILDNKLKVVKINPNNTNMSDTILNQEFYSITRTDEELSIVIDEDIDIQSDIVEYNWRAIKIEGIFVISTYNTDYILIKNDKLKNATEVLKQNGYEFV